MKINKGKHKFYVTGRAMERNSPSNFHSAIGKSYFCVF